MNYNISTHCYIRFFRWQWVKTKQNTVFSGYLRVPVSLAVLNAGRAGCFFPKISFYGGWSMMILLWTISDAPRMEFFLHIPRAGGWPGWPGWASELQSSASQGQVARKDMAGVPGPAIVPGNSDGKPEGFWTPLELWMTWLVRGPKPSNPRTNLPFKLTGGDSSQLKCWKLFYM